MKKSHFAGTSHRKTLDTRRLAAALAGPGIDPRLWVSYGTVGVLDDKGDLDVTDKRAVYVGPEGVEVDVLLEPWRIPVTCKYNGLQGGCETTFLTPILPGDQVLVHCPGGDLSQMPVVASILHSASCKVPLGEDRKPIFKNDRVFVWSKQFPVEVNAPVVRLGDQTSAEPMVLGTQYKDRITTLLNALKNDVRPSPVGPIAPSAGLISAIDTFLNELPNQLSDFIFGKKTPPTR